ncbi:hypothetical protein D9M68_981150 [compost metagenome]
MKLLAGDGEQLFDFRQRPVIAILRQILVQLLQSQLLVLRLCLLPLEHAGLCLDVLEGFLYRLHHELGFGRGHLAGTQALGDILTQGFHLTLR